MASPPPSPPPPPSDDQHVAEKSDEELYEMFLELQHRSRVVVQEILQRRRPDDQQTRDPQHSRVSGIGRCQTSANAGSSFERESDYRNSTPAGENATPPPLHKANCHSLVYLSAKNENVLVEKQSMV